VIWTPVPPIEVFDPASMDQSKQIHANAVACAGDRPRGQDNSTGADVDLPESHERGVERRPEKALAAGVSPYRKLLADLLGVLSQNGSAAVDPARCGAET
jgi:hypothetical protein